MYPSRPALGARSSLADSAVRGFVMLDRMEPTGVSRWRALLASRGCDAAAPVHVVELVTALLRIAQGDQRNTSADLRTSELFDRLDALEARLGKLLEQAGRSENLSRPVLAGIVAALEAATAAARSPRLHDGAAALIAAQVLDARLGGTFMDHFEGTRELKPGDPYPVVPFPLESLGAAGRKAVLDELDGPTGAPSNRTTWNDRVAHLRLAPDGVQDLRVRLRWIDPWLDPVTKTTSFAAVVTNRDLGDFEWTPFEVGQAPPEVSRGALDRRRRFYDVRARDPARQQVRIQTGLRIARERRASIVVLPELALTASSFDQLRSGGAFGKIGLLVAGSYHEQVPAGQAGANVAVVFAHGREVHRHLKFAEFHYGEPGGTRRYEHLRSRAELDGFDLLLGPRCTLVVLICKDALDERVKDLVRDLAPTLVLIPAMSPEVEDFELLAERLARDPQGFTLIACTGSPRGAIFGRPAKNRPYWPDAIPGPSLVIFSLNGGSHTFEIKDEDTFSIC